MTTVVGKTTTTASCISKYLPAAMAAFVALFLVNNPSQAQLMNEILFGAVEFGGGGVDDPFDSCDGLRSCNLYQRYYGDLDPTLVNPMPVFNDGYPTWNGSHWLADVVTTDSYTGINSTSFACEAWYSIWTAALAPDSPDFASYYGAQSTIVNESEMGDALQSDCSAGNMQSIACFGKLSSSTAVNNYPYTSAGSIDPLGGLEPVPVPFVENECGDSSLSCGLPMEGSQATLSWPAVGNINTVNRPSSTSTPCPSGSTFDDLTATNGPNPIWGVRLYVHAVPESGIPLFAQYRTLESLEGGTVDASTGVLDVLANPGADIACTGASDCPGVHELPCSAGVGGICVPGGRDFAPLAQVVSFELTDINAALGSDGPLDSSTVAVFNTKVVFRGADAGTHAAPLVTNTNPSLVSLFSANSTSFGCAGCVALSCDDCSCADDDLDGICWADDNCGDVANPGQEDTDGDGFGDVCDTCPGAPDIDGDLDSVLDCLDNCPLVSNQSQDDGDGDGVGDLCDQCPGGPDTDSDGDGVLDCVDNCPADPFKIEPGLCGCGLSDLDTDSDGVPDCLDNCPADFFKTEPGQCGCGLLDTDSDGDGVADCLDNCPDDPDRYPGAVELCNGIDDDCDGVVPGNEDDLDLDGYRICEADCDDSNADTYLGATEVNDGEDNQCFDRFGSRVIDWYGYGVADEIESGDITGNTFFWSAQPGATLYQHLRSSTPNFTSDCVSGTTTGDNWNDPATPPVGFCYYYLVRSVFPNVGSWGQSVITGEHWWEKELVERIITCSNLSETECSDLVDNDADDLVDCMDGDCDGVSGCEFGAELTCDDALDNDGDGNTDCNDTDCGGVSGCPFFPELICDDALDNDGDGPADCLDIDCNGISGCEFGSELTCNDALDNDGDGNADCLDIDCNGISGCEFGSELTCNDALDNDGDGNADCDDTDCDLAAPCQDTYTFQDTPTDDVSTTSLYDYFQATTPATSDHIFIELTRPSGSFATCSERADWYRDNYLTLATTSGNIKSGSWLRWGRSPTSADQWLSANEGGGESNFYGTDCTEAYSWCVEKIKGPGSVAHRTSVRPGRTDVCENSTWRSSGLVDACSDGTWQITIRIAPTRLLACGF